MAREGSITRAANFLHLTQPTLSRQMQDLEEELGRPLLIRKSHRVDLTPEGVLLRKRAEEIVSMVDKTEAEFTALEDTVSGDVYIGSGETRALCPIAKVIRQMRADSPGIRYHLYSGNAQDVTERLDKGLLDFGIVIEPADISKYDALSLPARDVWGVLMRRDSSLARKDRIEKADLLGLPLLCSRQVITPHPGENAFVDWFGADFGKLDIAVNYNLVFNAAILVEAGWAMPSPWTAWPTPRRRAPSASARWSRGWSRAWTSSGKSTRSFHGRRAVPQPPACPGGAIKVFSVCVISWEVPYMTKYEIYPILERRGRRLYCRSAGAGRLYGRRCDGSRSFGGG